MLFRSTCLTCHEPGPQWCRRCRFATALLPQVHVHPAVVGVPIQAALAFEGVAKDLVVALKYRNRRAAGTVLADLMVRRVGLAAYDVVTWAPTTASRAGRRGFDQSELLARAVARQLGVPCRRLLYRQHHRGDDQHQTGRTRWQRLIGPTFRARRPMAAMRVLVVDDVVTTGATMAAAVTALRQAGFGVVDAVAAAAARAETTPTRWPPSPGLTWGDRSAVVAGR